MNIPFAVEKGSAFLITDRLVREYLIDVSLDEGYLLVCENTAYFADARYFSAVKDQIKNKGAIPKLFLDKSSIKDYLIENEIKTLCLDFERTTVKEFNEYKEICADIKDCSQILNNARSVKSERELGLIKKACEIAEKAYYTCISQVKLGTTEKELAQKIDSLMLELGASEPSFPTIVAFGSNGAVPHHVTGDTPLTDNTPILIDMGAKYKGYCSDLTRTAFFGKPTQEFLSAYNGVLKANALAEENIRSGMSTVDADGVARNSLTADGYGEYFTHSLGHGVGLEIHEFPYLSPKRDSKLKDGMVFSIEPGIYFDGKFGIRIEDTVTLVNGKVKRLFTDGKELLIINK